MGFQGEAWALHCNISMIDQWTESWKTQDADQATDPQKTRNEIQKSITLKDFWINVKLVVMFNIVK